MAIERELAFSDAVAVAAHHASEEGIVLLVIVKVVKTEDHIPHFPRPVRADKRSHGAAVIAYARFDSVLVAQSENLHGRAIFGVAKSLSGDLPRRHRV